MRVRGTTTSWNATAVVVAAALASVGCTRSITAHYTPQLSAESIAKPIPASSFAVARFVDKRQWVVAGDSKSQSFVASQGPWKFGLSLNDSDYTPVNSFVQSVVVHELDHAGFKASAIDVLSDGGNLAALRNSAKAFDYALAGKVLTFEFSNDQGLVTVSTRRTVSLEVTLVEVSRGDSKVSDKVYQEGDNTNEGLGVLHSTNVDKLVRGPLLSVVRHIAEDLADRTGAAVGSIDLYLPYTPMRVVHLQGNAGAAVASSG